MAHYVILASFTDQGIRSIKETTARAKKFRDAAKQMGANIREIFWTLGSYDVVVTLEAPDDETVASLMMKVGAIGNLKSQTLRAFNEKEIETLTSRL